MSADLRRRYPAPKEGKTFQKKWNIYLPIIAERPEFNEAHLDQLEILCSLFEERDKLEAVLEITGPTYFAVTRAGAGVMKNVPEVNQLQLCVRQISVYIRMLNLNSKQKSTKGSKEDEESGNQWS